MFKTKQNLRIQTKLKISVSPLTYENDDCENVQLYFLINID